VKVSQLFGSTLKETPADVDVASHQLLLRAGYLRQTGSGIFSYLPLAWRALRKIEQVLREEMDAIGGQEVSLPVVHPAEVWQASGRWDAIGPEMVRFTDRRGADLCLAMTHEEVVAQLAKSELSSYRQLPALVYQIQTKFRDEPRARAGLIRVREFVMKDSYSLDLDVDGLQAQYDHHYQAYFRIFRRCGLPVIAVASDTGMMGGRVAHEFMYVTPIGEDHLVTCAASGYAANREVAEFRKQAEDNGPPRPLRDVHTPDARTIDELTAMLDLPATRLAKHVLFAGRSVEQERDVVVVAMVRGDMDANPIAVARVARVADLRPAHPEELQAVGIEPGFASAVGLTEAQREGVVVVADDLLAQTSNLVVGANTPDHHLVDAQLDRDVKPDAIGHIALAGEGALDVQSGEPLELVRGVEVGNIFQLGTKYTDAVDATVLDESGRAASIVMGSYGIGVGRALACVAEHHRDDDGLALPISVAPFEVYLVSLARKADAVQVAEALYTELCEAGVEVLFDDRKKLSAGFKFAEADLRGMPLRVVVSDRGLKGGTVELQRRLATWVHDGPEHTERPDAVHVPVDEAVEAIRSELAQMRSELGRFAAG
jgi:prolyl-tRNA synthetase